jgi:AcrR family transcriptional regulator
MKTKDRIKTMALKMFNEQGERNVTTNHIAAALDISPGNLYYHYRNKYEIIHTIFEEYGELVTGYLSLPQGRPLAFEDKAEIFESIFTNMWDYRFLHRDVTHFLEESEELRRAYNEFAVLTMQKAVELYQGMVAAGIIVADEAQINAMVVNSWVLVQSWTSFVQSVVVNSAATKLNEEMLSRGIYQIICIDEPYVSEEWRDEVAVLKKRFWPHEKTDPFTFLMMANQA